MDTAAVIVTYNRKALLKECILALLEQIRSCDILVIDNHSTDGTGDMVRELMEAETKAKAEAVGNDPESSCFSKAGGSEHQVQLCESADVKETVIANPRIIYKDTGSNLGGAGGFSYGIREAVELGYEYIWIMDDDCIPDPGALKELFAAADKLERGNMKPEERSAERAEGAADSEAISKIKIKRTEDTKAAKPKEAYGFLASKVLWTDGSICRTNVQRYPMARRVKDFESELVRVNYSSFVSMFFKSSIVRELGLPIKEFFIWSDDLEYTRRISMKYPCWLCNKSVVVHKCKGNYGINIAVELPERVDRYKYIYRNDVYVFRKEGLKGFLYVAVRDLYHVVKVLLTAKEGKLSKIRTIIGGTLSGLSFDPKIEYVNDQDSRAKPYN